MFRDLIKLWVSLINKIGSLIEELINLEDLIKFWISLINEIRGLIETILKFSVGMGHNCKQLKSRDKIKQWRYYKEFNWFFPGVILKELKV
jgi:hypothetical protein